MKKRSFKKAQQLVEFLLVAPFLVIILGILTEYAYALNIYMTVNTDLKAVGSSIYSQIKPGMTESNIKTLLSDEFIEYLNDNNIPANSENNINVSYVTEGETAILMARYTYIPAFSLPNVYFKFLPDKFNFLATYALPAAFLSANNYDENIDSITLDKIWSSSADFSSQDSFNDSKKGIMKLTEGRNNILFLVPATNVTVLTNPYVLVSWSGSILANAVGDSYVVDTDNGVLYACTDTTCTANGSFFSNLTSSGNSYYNIIFVHDEEADDVETLDTYWAYDTAGTPIDTTSTDLSDNSVDGILKRTLALITINNGENLSIGNYDNISVVSYNANVSEGNSYIGKSFGSMVFLCSSTDTIENIINGQSETNYNYDFGARIN